MKQNATAAAAAAGPISMGGAEAATIGRDDPADGQRVDGTDLDRATATATATKAAGGGAASAAALELLHEVPVGAAAGAAASAGVPRHAVGGYAIICATGATEAALPPPPP